MGLKNVIMNLPVTKTLPQYTAISSYWTHIETNVSNKLADLAV
jgi:hypothetical protein